MNCKDKLKNWWENVDAKMVLIATLGTAIVVYFYYLSLEPINSDCLAEGFLEYHNTRWAISLGRWGVPLFASFTGNVILPTLYLLLCVLCVAFSVMLLSDLWKIQGRLIRCLLGSLMIVAPAVVYPMVSIHAFLSCGISGFLSILSVYVLLSSNKLSHFIAASLIMTFALGSYQPYIGVILVTLIGSLILKIFRQDDISFIDLLKTVLRMGVFFVCGLGLYWLSMQLLFKIFDTGLSEYAGVNQIGIINTIINTLHYVKRTYREFIAYYRDTLLAGNLFWYMLFIITLLGIAFLLVKEYKKKKYWKIPVVLMLIFIMPPCANLIDIIVPGHGIQLHMTYQMHMLAPICIAVIDLVIERIEFAGKLFRNSISLIVMICFSGLIIGYSMRAYSSFRTVDIGSRYIKYNVGNALSHALEDEAYTEGMPIVFMGFVNDDPVQEKNPLRKYSYYERAYPFWKDKGEVFYVWPEYCWYYFGIDIGNITEEQYDQIIDSEEFASMEQYPSGKAYKVINDCYVIVIDSGSVAK